MGCDSRPPPPRPTTHAFIWPLPSSYTNGSTLLGVTFTPSASFFVGPTGSALLKAAFGRYSSLTFPHTTDPSAHLDLQATAGTITSLVVTVDSTAEDFPQLETDESYKLSVTAASATLHAKTVFGALRGLETFSQLVVFDFNTGGYTLPYAPWTITDTPRFPHRGLMIDSARHFLPIKTIKKVINALPYAKLNVLHWHMVRKFQRWSACFSFQVCVQF